MLCYTIIRDCLKLLNSQDYDQPSCANVAMSPHLQCLVCEKHCFDLSCCILCALCKNRSHFKCVNLDKTHNPNTIKGYYCSSCLKKFFPFQSVDNGELVKTMQTNFSAFKAFNTLKYASSTNFTNSELSGNQGCKYRSVEWYSNNFLNLLKYNRKHTLNIIHFNTRSLTKNKSKIEELLQML